MDKANIVGFDKALADKANAEKLEIKKAQMRKATVKAQSAHIKFAKDSSLSNNPFAQALQGVKIDG